MHEAELILATGALLAAGLFASLVAGRLRVPGLVLFLGVGMAIGSDGIGWIEFDDYELARTIGIIALAPDPLRGRPDRRAATRSGRCCGPRSASRSSGR